MPVRFYKVERLHTLIKIDEINIAGERLFFPENDTVKGLINARREAISFASNLHDVVYQARESGDIIFYEPDEILQGINLSMHNALVNVINIYVVYDEQVEEIIGTVESFINPALWALELRAEILNKEALAYQKLGVKVHPFKLYKGDTIYLLPDDYKAYKDNKIINDES